MARLITNGGFEAWTGDNAPTGWTITVAADGTGNAYAGSGKDDIEDIGRQWEGGPSGMKAPSIQDPDTKAWTGFGSFRAGTFPSTKSLDLRVSNDGHKITAHQHLTLKANTSYRLRLRYRLGFDLNEDGEEEQVQAAEAPFISLVEDGTGHSLKSDGTFQGDALATVPLTPIATDEWKEITVRFTTPATHTAYTLTIDTNNLQGTEYVAYDVGPPEVAQVVGYAHLYVDEIQLDELDSDGNVVDYD